MLLFFKGDTHLPLLALMKSGLFLLTVTISFSLTGCLFNITDNYPSATANYIAYCSKGIIASILNIMQISMIMLLMNILNQTKLFYVSYLDYKWRIFKLAAYHLSNII
jgi:hypothetical protein